MLLLYYIGHFYFASLSDDATDDRQTNYVCFCYITYISRLVIAGDT